MFIKRIGNLICSMSADIPTKNLSDNSCLFFIHFKPTVYDIKPKRRTSNFIQLSIVFFSSAIVDCITVTVGILSPSFYQQGYHFFRRNGITKLNKIIFPSLCSFYVCPHVLLLHRGTLQTFLQHRQLSIR